MTALIARVGLAVLLTALVPVSGRAQEFSPPAQPTPDQPPVFRQQVEVVATRLPEAPHDIPDAIEVLDGELLRSLGVTTLSEALALATGVVVAQGGDAGPASSVPEFRGLREFDAFLLVVDGIPWGGAFNPALTTLSLRDVERVEILRGPAPVTFGATSFVGVIHVVHKSGAARQTYASADIGRFGSGGGALDIALPHAGGWDSRLTVDGERRGFSDPRTNYSRGHALWRGARSGENGKMWTLVDLTLLNQRPASPQPRSGVSLDARVPLDANHNPSGAFLDDSRLTAAFGFDRPGWHHGQWSLTTSFARSSQDLFRGFLTSVAAVPENATGFHERLDLTEVYADTHLTWPLRSRVRFAAGGDFLHGNGGADGATFSYSAPLVGAPAASVAVPGILPLHVEDRREFAGAYALAEWTATPRLRVNAGVRLNMTFEEGGDGPEAAGAQDKPVSYVRPSGSIGAIFTGWERGADHVKLYADYRDTFKPAAVDFGLGEAAGGAEDAGKLKPETARNYEGGLKMRLLQARLDVEANAFVMDFANLVTATTVNGLPALMNTGTQRFQGIEVSADARLNGSLAARSSYSFHDAHFTSFAQTFDGVPTSLNGNRLELSARHLASAGVVYGPSTGPVASLVLNYTGSRYLDRRNRALTPGFTTIDLGGGYRLNRWEVRVDGRNLSDRRDPIAESELGDAQYYRLPARTVLLTVAARF